MPEPEGEDAMKHRRSRQGQTMVEYIIIVVIVAIAAIAVFGIFGDTLRQKLSGAVSEMDSGGNASAAQQAAGQTGDSRQWLKDLTTTGSGTAP
jgi:Flp pilus assembly pilin Flp